MTITGEQIDIEFGTHIADEMYYAGLRSCSCDNGGWNYQKSEVAFYYNKVTGIIEWEEG